MGVTARDLSRSATLLASALLVGCTWPFSPRESHALDGEFVLVAVYSEAPPVVTPNESDLGVGLETTVVADTLFFGPGRDGTWRSTWHRRPITGGEAEVYFIEFPLRYRRTGDRVEWDVMACTSECRRFFGETAIIDKNGVLHRQRSGGGEWKYERLERAVAP